MSSNQSYHDGHLLVGPNCLGFFYDEKMKHPINSIGFSPNAKDFDQVCNIYLGNNSEYAIKNIKIEHSNVIKIESYPEYLPANTAKPINMTILTKGKSLLSYENNDFDMQIQHEVVSNV